MQRTTEAKARKASERRKARGEKKRNQFSEGEKSRLKVDVKVRTASELTLKMYCEMLLEL